MTISVLMFCPQYRPLVGGAERQAEKLARALVRRGVQVTVLTPRLVLDTPLTEDDLGVKIKRFPFSHLGQRFPGVRGLGPLILLQIRAQVRAALRRHIRDVDIVHAHIASPMTAFAVELAKAQRVPTICKLAMAGERSDLEELVGIGLGGRSLARSMVRGVDRWIATTQAVADSLDGWAIPADRIAFIPNGVDLPVLTDPASKSSVAKRFLYLGRLSSNIQRDLPTLVRAFDRLASVHSAVELAIVGDGDLFEETASLVAKCSFADRISLPGNQPPDQWLEWADCLVLPSRREGLSNALLEAMAHGLACIANDIPPNREVLADGAAGTLVPIGDRAALFAAMDRMARDAEHTRTMQTAALKNVRDRFGIDSVADRYIDLYRYLVTESRR